MLDFFIKSISIILTMSAFVAAIIYPLQVFKSPSYLLNWRYSNDKSERKKIYSYILLAFIGTFVWMFGGIKVFLWWVPDNFRINTSTAPDEVVIALILAAFLFEQLTKLPKKLNDLRLLQEEYKQIKSDYQNKIKELTVKNEEQTSKINDLEKTINIQRDKLADYFMNEHKLRMQKSDLETKVILLGGKLPPDEES